MMNNTFIKYWKYRIIKDACETKEKVYLLIRKDTLEVVRMAWGASYKEAHNYFVAWLADTADGNLTMNDCFVAKVRKKSII